MSGAVQGGEIAARLAVVRRLVARSPEPLHRPLDLVFRPRPGEAGLQAWADHARAVAAGTTFAPATLYVNIPFCARVCTYCLLSSIRVPSRAVLEDYVRALCTEIDLYAPVVAPLTFGSLHVGGGTPTLLGEAALETLFDHLARLPLSPGARIGVEAHPATATPARLGVLARHGVHRVSLGVETMTDQVLANVNRGDQTAPRVAAAVAAARALGLEVNLDLLAGLPGETLASWEDTVRRALALAPDSLSVNRYFAENSPLAACGYRLDEGARRRVDEMLLAADALIRAEAPPRFPETPLHRAGFGTQYVWDRSPEARRYFQEDMIGPVSTLGLGSGALGHVYGRHYAIPAGGVAEYLTALGAGRPPAILAAEVDARFEMAFFVADQASRGELSLGGFRRVFGRGLEAVFGPELDHLFSEGLLHRDGDRVSKPPRRDFQVVHLMALLAYDRPRLEAMLRALDAGAPAPPPRRPAAAVGPASDLEALLATADPEGVVRLDAGAGLDAETATRLATLARARGLALEVAAEEGRLVDEYTRIEEELPPSMLWVRLAIRASRARQAGPDAP